MQTRSKKPVWLLFKVLELVLSGVGCYVHIRCFQSEGTPHIFLLCATYGGSAIICALSIIGMFYAEKPTMKLEAAISGLLGTLHMLTVYANMYLAEHDIELMFLKNREEHQHAFYICCKKNAIIALYAAAIFYLHCTFALDLMYTHRSANLIRKHPQRSKRPLKLYFISIGVEHFLSRFKWFHLMSANMLRSRQQSARTLQGADIELSLPHL
ncbi:uncharacterized protein Dwil_GK19222 [Drosophila willistoni]|uniref:DUF7775 domain-containing protein n=1 Tax=Drosophila willistoni TaxID=7260 RepID=B4NNA6_DROWI|nr:uncharacterized protein LOC6652138 [Drosophila willistoni]EDW85845.1 uncharacterized protein Dwil_GK19222 [Drosophila willistoni]